MRLMRLAAFVLAVALSAPAWAAKDNACWNRNIQRMDYYTDPPQGGDSAFFSVQSKSGVIALIYPTKASMKEFPLSLYEIRNAEGGSTPTGCTNAYFNRIKYGLPYADTAYDSYGGTYNSSLNYPDPESAYASSSQPISDGLTRNKVYRYLNWGPTPTGSAEDASTACETVANNTWSATNTGGFANAEAASAACQSCMSSKGYWLNPLVGDNDATTNAGVFSTNFLRFYPPKWVILKLAYKRMVSGPLLGTLREGVIAANGIGDSTSSNDGKGAILRQKLLPSSCSGKGAENGAGILKQKLDAVEGLSYTSKAFPLAEMLLNDGWYQSGNVSSWCCSGSSAYFTNSNVLTTDRDLNDGKGGPCPGCNQDFLIVFSDGRGDTANPHCTRKSDGSLPGPCQAEQQCSTLGMGAEKDGDNYLDPSLSGGTGSAITGSSVRQTPNGTCEMDFADDVAGFLADHQMNQSAAGSNLYSYVVAIGSERYGAMNSLQAVASRGKGSYIIADDFTSFENALTSTLLQIIQRTESFSVAAITTVQTRGTTYAFIPRFTPQQGNDWAGKLYRFNLFNEFSAGCQTSDYGSKNFVNPNGNNSCSDVYLKDANGAFVGDDTSGNIVLLDTSSSYPWPTKPPTGTAPNQVPQYGTPIWEASATLTTRINALNAGTSTDERSIYTVYDSNSDGTYDTLIPFSTSSTYLATLTSLLELEGVTSDFCLEMASKSGHTYAAETDCATDVINFIRGKDVFLQNAANRTTPKPTYQQARPNPLGDIYHSSPIVVIPPSSTFLCDLGVITQCSQSLYASSLTPGGSTYNDYQSTYSHRIEPLLVGANDGMLHAFNAGNDTTGDDPDTNAVEGSSNHYYDRGTGREMWAFIPPDLLPKLRLYVIGTRHEMFVDGTPFVKDIWVDGSGGTTADHKKQADEFHTIAIVGEREGGRSYFALDVTNPSSPVFKWAWPPPGSTDAMNAGQSWNDYAPSPPPVGPIAVADSSGPLTINGVKASERYVVAVGGGYDENLVRGAGYYILDAWTGQQLYRATRVDVTSGSSDPRASMFPIAATPSFLDINNDGLFDTLIVGDVLGQVWVSNLAAPGKDTSGDGIFDNWFAARAFIQFKGLPLWHRSPFFQMASTAVLTTGDVRVYLGTGNRDQIKNPSHGGCELADPFSCIRDNCSVNVKQITYQNDSQYMTAEWKYAAGGTSLATNTYSIDNAADGNSCSDSASVHIETDLTCGSTSLATQINAITCTWPGTPECSGDGKPESTTLTYTAPTTENARLYSIHLYDSSGSRVPFTSATQAAAYDAAALTDSDLVDADTTAATATGNGYYVKYSSAGEKTASEALVLAGCVIVNTLSPTTLPADYCGGSLPLDTNYVYQADATTGSIACGTSAPASTATVRYGTQTAIVPPPMPTPVVAVNQATSTVVYSGISLAPGAPPSQFTIGGGDIQGPVEWLEISRKTHDCRHNGTNCK